MRYTARHPQALFAELGPNLFASLRSASQAGDEVFRNHYLPVLERLAFWLQELPLEKKTYSERGGALRFALLSSLGTMRMCSGVIFASSSDSERRRAVEPQYRFAAFVASLCTVPLIVHHNVSILVNDLAWTPYLSRGLYDELAKSGRSDSGYEVTWKAESAEKASEALGVLLLPRLLEEVKWGLFDPTVIRHMVEAINPAGKISPAEPPLSKVVRVGHEKARSLDLLRAATKFVPGADVDGVDPQVEAMDRLSTEATTHLETSQPNPATAPAPTPAGKAAQKTIPQTAPAVPSGPPSSVAAPPVPQVATEDDANIHVPKAIRQWAAVVHMRDEFWLSIQPVEPDLVQVFKKALSYASDAALMKETLERAGLVHTVLNKPVSLLLRKPVRDLLFPSGVPASYPINPDAFKQ